MAIAASSLNVNDIVKDLMAAERRPLAALDLKEASYQAKISALGSVRSALSSLQQTVTALAQPNTFKALNVVSSEAGIVSGSADTKAAPGNYSITVDKLAKAHVVRSNGTYASSSATFNTGSLSIKVGNGSAVNIDITTSNNSLSQVRNAINNSGAGVSASIVNDGTSQRLVLTSKTMGANGAITVTANDSGSGGTSSLAELASTNLIQVQSADDAELTVNGLSIKRSTNTISDVVEGLSLTLGKTGSTTVSVSANPSTAIAAVTAFVSAYNAVVAQNASLGAYNPASNTSSVLTGDTTLRSIQTKLGNLSGEGVSGIPGGISHLSDVGISLQQDGTLKLDTGKLASALNNPEKNVAALFTQTTQGNEGIAVRFNTWLMQSVGSGGAIAGRIDGINRSIAQLDEKRDAINLRLITVEKRYRSQYSALDALITSMGSTSSFLDQQLSNLPGSGRK